MSDVELISKLQLEIQIEFRPMMFAWLAIEFYLVVKERLKITLLRKQIL